MYGRYYQTIGSNNQATPKVRMTSLFCLRHDCMNNTFPLKIICIQTNPIEYKVKNINSKPTFDYMYGWNDILTFW